MIISQLCRLFLSGNVFLFCCCGEVRTVVRSRCGKERFFSPNDNMIATEKYRDKECRIYHVMVVGDVMKMLLMWSWRWENEWPWWGIYSRMNGTTQPPQYSHVGILICNMYTRSIIVIFTHIKQQQSFTLHVKLLSKRRPPLHSLTMVSRE